MNEQLLLNEMFKAAKTSSNFTSVEWVDEDYDWQGPYIHIKSKLLGEADKHLEDLDEFDIGMTDEGTIAILYTPSGSDWEDVTMEQFLLITRCHE